MSKSNNLYNNDRAEILKEGGRGLKVRAGEREEEWLEGAHSSPDSNY